MSFETSFSGRIVILLLLSCCACYPQQERAATVPVIYSTDLFHPYEDADDHFDLATLFALPELDVRMVVLDLGQLQQRGSGAIPVRQMNYLTGRKVPFRVGLENPLRYPEDKALDQFTPETPNVILRVLKESAAKVTIITTGSVRDVAAAFNRDPTLFREKVDRIYIVDGNSAAADLQWNPRLDPQAYLRLMRSDLPIYWTPCFGGRETIADLAAGKLGTLEYQSYWKFRQSDLLESLPLPLQNFFLYALGQKNPSLEDPIEYLRRPTLEEPLREQQWTQTRNMWSTVALYDAARRSLYRKADSWASLQHAVPGYERLKVYDYIPAAVSVDRDLRTTLSFPDKAGTLRVLRVTDLKSYQQAMLGSLRQLLSGMALQEGEDGVGKATAATPRK